MAISDKLALEIFTIIGFHLIACMALFSFGLYIYFKARKNLLLYSYMAVIASFLIWMFSKIFKTVAPTIELRWIFIVTQYIGINALGVVLIVFAFVYLYGRLPSKNKLILLSIPPSISMLIMATNPLHMLFYSYFDFYKDRFGPVFYPAQGVQYLYWLVGIIMLSNGFSKQPIFKGKRGWATFFSGVTLIPLLANAYYILFKLGVFKWIFPFKVFDITPIFGSLALILFTIPAMQHRFFDILPLSYRQLFETMDQCAVFYNPTSKKTYAGNPAYQRIEKQLQDHAQFWPFLFEEHDTSLEFPLYSKDTKALQAPFFYAHKTQVKPQLQLVVLQDITQVIDRRHILQLQQKALIEKRAQLSELAAAARTLAVTKTKSQMAQCVHDILGHSLTVVIGSVDLASSCDSKTLIAEKLANIGELLKSSLSDLKNTFKGQNHAWGHTSLTKAVQHLLNPAIEVVFTLQGKAYELNSYATEAIYRTCQESITNAIKHGRAKQIHIIMRYEAVGLTLFIIDNGLGCSQIVKNYGLSGIDDRIKQCSGHVSYGSDGEKGFSIKAFIPVTPAFA